MPAIPKNRWITAPLLVVLLGLLAIYPVCVSAQVQASPQNDDYTSQADGYKPCPADCGCLTEAQAKEKFGDGNYQLCRREPCGEMKPPSGLRPILKYCFKAKAPCPQGCTCMTDEKAKELGYQPCFNQRIPCGYDENKRPLYCYSPPTPPPATCPEGCLCLNEAQAKNLGYTRFCRNEKKECGKDASGNVMYCYEVPVTPQPQQCSFDYGLEKCTGSCPDGTGCVLNTIKRDPETGKVTYADCHCKG